MTKNAHRQPVVTTGQRRDPTDGRPAPAPGPRDVASVVETEDPAACLQRVRVGEQRVVHRQRVRLCETAPDPCHEQPHRTRHETGREHRRPTRPRSRTTPPWSGVPRSARLPNGSAPRTNRTPNAPPIAPITAVAHAEARLDVGCEHRQRGAVEPLHDDDERAAPTIVATPPDRTAARSPTGSSPTPGSRSSGSTVRSDAGRGACRVASCSRTTAARRAGSAGAPRRVDRASWVPISERRG